MQTPATPGPRTFQSAATPDALGSYIRSSALHQPAEARKVLECGGKRSATPLFELVLEPVAATSAKPTAAPSHPNRPLKLEHNLTRESQTS